MTKPMTPERKQELKDSFDSVVAFLMEFRKALDSPVGEPDALCGHCGQVFETKALVIEHVSVCEKNPLVQEIKRLEELAKGPTNKCSCGNIINHDYCTRCIRLWES